MGACTAPARFEEHSNGRLTLSPLGFGYTQQRWVQIQDVQDASNAKQRSGQVPASQAMQDTGTRRRP